MTTIFAELDLGNRNLPIASGFRVNFCGDPKCGPHFFLLDKNNETFLEMVMTAEQISLVERQTMEHLAGIPKP